MRTWIHLVMMVVLGMGTTSNVFAIPPIYVDIGHPYADDSTSNLGTDPNSPLLTLGEAVKRASGGWTVYVRARPGLYYDPIVMETSGSPTSPIKFIGYNTATTDLNDGSGVPKIYYTIDTDEHSGVPASSIDRSPVISGTGTAVDFAGKDWIEFRNFWVSGTAAGIQSAGSDHCVIENIYVFNCGNPLSGWEDGIGIKLSGSTDNTIANCTCYNVGDRGILLVDDSDANTVDSCRVFSDDDRGFSNGDSLSATHYYFLITASSGNTIQNCKAQRYPDPESGDMPRHSGHGFLIQANGDDGEEATLNLVKDCTTLDIGDAMALRWTGAHDNLFENVESYIVHEADDDGPTPLAQPVGHILLEGGPRENVFRRCQIGNGTGRADTGVRVLGDGGDFDANFTGSVASYNLFVNCIFKCELAIELNDFDDELDGINGDLTDGTTQKFKGNVFWHCDFIGDPNPINLSANGYNNMNRFFRSSRHAEDNWIISCIISDFDRFSEGTSSATSAENASITPLPLADEGAFTFKHCFFDISNLWFWYDASPDDAEWFDEDDLGDGNSLTTYIDAGFTGDWDGDSDIEPGQDRDAAGVAGFPEEYMEVFPTAHDYNDNYIRIDGAPDIGSQEEP